MDNNIQKILDSLEITQKEFWNISKQTGNFLNMLVKIHNSKNVLEIGTSNGYSGLWFLDALNQTGGHLHTIEFYDKRQNIAKENFNNCGFKDKYTAYCGDALETIKKLPKDIIFDFVFFDANKREYIEYFKNIRPYLAKNSIVTADNVNSHREKVQPFLDEIISDKEFQTEILDLPGGLSISYMNCIKT